MAKDREPCEQNVIPLVFKRTDGVLPTPAPALTTSRLERDMADRLIRTYRFKLKPTRAQHGRLREALEHSRQLYNAALEERIDYYRKSGKSRSFVDQCRGLVELRSDPVFARWPSVMQRGALRRLDNAYRAFFRRGGFPRFVSLALPFAAVLFWLLYDWIKCGDPWEDIKDMALPVLGAGLLLTWLLGSILLATGELP